MSEKPTSEWTVEWALSWIPSSATPVQRKILATGLRDVLNAALAAEGERVTREIFDRYCDDPTEGAMRAKEKEIQQLRAQVQTLVVAIKRMQGAAMDELPAEVQQVGDAALAKIGGGK